MQSTLCAPISALQFPSPEKSPEPCFFTQRPNSRKPHKVPLAKTFASRSLRTSVDFEPREGLHNGPGPKPGPVLQVRLPVVIRKSGTVSRYLSDGGSLVLVRLDGGHSSSWFDFDDGLRSLFRACNSTLKNFFIPQQVPSNYMGYVKWKLVHRVFSSALHVLGTQAMFRAIGVGYSRALPSAAAFNWLLKDGLGRLSRCIYTASLASAFDNNLKRVRFTTSTLFTLSIGIELLTPAFPQYFLLLASVANIAKQISLACYLATSSAVHRSFAITDNLGEISAKAQVQSVCFENLGLLLAAILNLLFKNSQRLQAGFSFVLYPIFAAIDLFGIYQQLKHVHLQTLTKDRLEVILNTWIKSRYVPSPAEVSEEEGIDFLWRKGKGMWPIRIGCLNPQDQLHKLSLMSLQSVSDEDHYFVCMEILHKGFRRSRHQGIILCLREGAKAADVIMGLLEACYIRSKLLSGHWEKAVDRDVSDKVVREWFELVDDSKRSALGDFDLLFEQMSGIGWAVKNVLLSTEEQVRYTYVDK